jgi:hypothetical protein
MRIFEPGHAKRISKYISFTKEKLKFEPDPYAIDMIGLLRIDSKQRWIKTSSHHLVFYCFALIPLARNNSLHHSCASKCNYHPADFIIK